MRQEVRDRMTPEAAPSRLPTNIYETLGGERRRGRLVHLHQPQLRLARAGDRDGVGQRLFGEG
jgi:hypothetical protein